MLHHFHPPALVLLFSSIYHSELGRGKNTLSKNSKSYIMHCVVFLTISLVPPFFKEAAELKSINNVNRGFKTHFPLNLLIYKLKIIASLPPVPKTGL